MAKPNWKEIRDHLKDYRADPEAILAYLDDLRERCKDGIVNDINTARGDVVSACQKYPDVELRTTQEIWKVTQHILEMADQEAEDKELIIQIHRAKPAAQ